MRILVYAIFILLLAVMDSSAQLEFADGVKINRSTAEVGVADVNMDGHPDIVISNASQRWYEGPDFTTWHLIGVSDGGPYAARVADMNGDGWADLVTSDGTRTEENMPGNIYLYLNPGADGDVMDEWQRIIVYTGQVRHQNDMRIADMDGDGLMDIIEKTWSSERVVVSLQNADINTWTTRAFDTGETGKPEGISAGDIDGDGENEIVLSGVYWDNPGGWRTGSPVEYIIDSDFVQEEVKSAVADIDNDGDNDVYMGSCEGNYKFLAWYENDGSDGNGGTTFIKHLIKANTGKYHMVELIDIDFDGDLDLATGKSFGDTGCVIFYNENNGTTWTESVYDADGTLYTGIVADLDSDGDFDIVGPERFNGPVYYYINETPGDPAVAPSDLLGTLIDGRDIQLNWTDNSDNEGSFEIEVFVNGAWSAKQVSAANSVEYLDDDITPNTSYQYRIRAANAAGVSEWDSSNVVTTWDQVTPVIIAPVEGNFVDPPTIIMMVGSGGYDFIKYTTDGSDPDENSIVYSDPFVLDNSAIIKAYAGAVGYIDSPISSGYYNVAENGNFPPIAIAGEDQVTSGFGLVTLDGTLSSDIDDPMEDLQYLWTQLEGPTVQLNEASSVLSTFQSAEVGVHIFELEVIDDVTSDRDTVRIDVRDLSSDLLAYWPLDETSGNVANELINDQNASLNSGVSWDPIGGKISGALQFDGISGRAEISAINAADTAMTITMWIKVPSFDNVEGRMISKASGVSGNDHVWMVSQIEGSALRYRLNIDGGTTTTLASSTGVIPQDEWIFISARYDGNTMKIYKNAVEMISTTQSGDITQSNATVAIGNQPIGAGDRPFLGWIDDVRLYNKALTLAELEELYNDICEDYLTLENVTLETDGTFSAKQEIILKNVIVPESINITLKAPNVRIDEVTNINQGANIIVQKVSGCN